MNEPADAPRGAEPLRCLPKLPIARGQKFYGPGIHQLLQLVQQTGSMRLACTEMGLSYSKAWKIVGTMETQLGFAVVRRSQGGKNGGKTELTAEGRSLLQRYAGFSAECGVQINALFKKYFSGFADV